MYSNKLYKILTISFVASIAIAGQKEDRKQKINEIFDNDSDFMRGFETGLFLRTKGGNIEEYGCAAPSVTNNKSNQGIFDTIKTSINAAS